MPKQTLTFKSFRKEVMRDLENKEFKLLKKAAVHVKKKVKSKLGKRQKSSAGEPPAKFSGNLIKGIKEKTARGKFPYSYVGAVAPAFHAMLLELGTRKMKARPFLTPTFIEEKNAIIDIMSEVRV